MTSEAQDLNRDRLLARLSVDPCYGITVAVKDQFAEIGANYERLTGDRRALGPDSLARRLCRLYQDGQVDLVRSVCRVPYQGGMNAPEVDDAVREVLDAGEGAPDAVPKGWLGDLVGIVVDVAQGGRLGASDAALNAERERLARLAGARDTVRTATLVLAVLGAVLVGLILWRA